MSVAFDFLLTGHTGRTNPACLNTRRSTPSSSFPLFLSSKNSSPRRGSRNNIATRTYQKESLLSDNNGRQTMSSQHDGKSNMKKLAKNRKGKQHSSSNKITHQHRTNRKVELERLVKDIGLKPVGNKSNKSIIETTHDHNGYSIHQISSMNQVKLPIKVQLQYARNGHSALRSMFPVSLISTIKADLVEYAASKELNAWKQKVDVATNSPSILSTLKSIEDCKQVLLQQQQGENIDVPTIPFLQYFNTWRDIPSVEAFVKSPLLVSMAKQLLDVPKVKLYQDSLFHKRSLDASSPTPWHSDARMTPFDTSIMITFWIPMDFVPDVHDGGTGLFFVDKSHNDFALPYWNQCSTFDNVDAEINGEYDRLDVRYGGESAVCHHMPLKVGDATCHAGWTLHMANGMKGVKGGRKDISFNERYALAVSYVDDRAEIRLDAFDNYEDKSHENDLGHNEDRWSYATWLNDGTIKPRRYFQHSLVPTL